MKYDFFSNPTTDIPVKSLKTLNSELLLDQTRELARKEKQLTLEILYYLREIEKRRLFAELGYSSLYEFAIEELKYSGGAAFRRIESMRLLREVPEAEEHLKNGYLNISVLSTAQNFLRSEKKRFNRQYTKEQKKELIEKLCGKTTREVERTLCDISPYYIKLKDKERPLGEDCTEIRFVADQELKEMLEKVKNLVSNSQDPNPDYCTLFKKMVSFYLKKKDPASKSTLAKTNVNIESKTEEFSAPKTKQEVRTENKKEKRKPLDKNSRYINTKTRNDLYQRSNGVCEYIDPKTQKRCQSRRALQIEHIHPFSKGGKNQIQNLQLLCMAHNQYRAIQAYGVKKMSEYIQSLET